MVLGGKAKVEEEDACESEDNACKQDLNRQRARERRLVFEHWVVWQTAGSKFEQCALQSRSWTSCNGIKTHGSSESPSPEASTFTASMRTERDICRQPIFVHVRRPDVLVELSSEP